MSNKPYSVNIWGSHPDEGNDDCHSGTDFATLDEAREAARNWRDHFDHRYYDDISVAFIEVDGPDTNEVSANPRHDPVAAERRYRAYDEEWRREIAMQAGMGMGVDAYNDAMGYGYEPWD